MTCRPPRPKFTGSPSFYPGSPDRGSGGNKGACSVPARADQVMAAVEGPPAIVYPSSSDDQRTRTQNLA